MKVLTEGHFYQLENFEEEDAAQVLQFVEKRETENNELVTVQNGTTSEEVLRVLIDRMKYLQKKIPCRENAIVITKLEECLMWLEKRMADRKARGVQGKKLT